MQSVLILRSRVVSDGIKLKKDGPTGTSVGVSDAKLTPPPLPPHPRVLLSIALPLPCVPYVLCCVLCLWPSMRPRQLSAVSIYRVNDHGLIYEHSIDNRIKRDMWEYSHSWMGMLKADRPPSA